MNGGQRLKLCIAQMGMTSSPIDRHLERICQTIFDHRDADLVVFPELTLHGHPNVEHPEGLLYRKARVLYGPLSTRVYRFVQSLETRVIIGEIRRKGDELYNVATYIDRNGPQFYRKTHVHWTENFVPGHALKCFETPFGKIGINVCFDAAFPEVWRALALEGARLIVNVSAVPTHFPWQIMHRRMASAALNNQVFVAYANRPEPRFSGRSAIFDPLGDVVVAAGPSEQIFEAEIDLGRVEAWRDEEKLYEFRRPRLYRLRPSRAS